MSKRASLLLITVLAVSSLIVVSSAFAQSITKPSIPEFTVKFIDRSYDVPVTYRTTTDPFTGKQVTTSSGGYHVTNMTVDVIIKNQHFIPVDLHNGTVIQLYYNVRAKGHFADWIPVASGGYSFKRILESTSDYTVVTFVIGSENDMVMGRANVYIPPGGQEDFQVQAQVGYLVPDYGGHILPVPISYDFISFGESSWSDIQTLTIGYGLEQVILIGAASAAIVIGACLVLVYFIKRKVTKRTQ